MVEANEVLSQYLTSIYGRRSNPIKYATVTRLNRNENHPSYAGLVDMQFLHGRRWTRPQPIWLPKGSEFLPVPEDLGQRIQRFKERYEQNYLGNKFTVPLTTSGADPEIFVVDKKMNRVIPAFAFLPEKKRPLLFYDGNDRRVNAFWDGFQAEFTTNAFHCLQEMCSSLQVGLLNISQTAKAKFPDAILSPDSVVEIEPEVMGALADQHVALGCARSENAYGTPNIQVANPKMLPFRFAGGHIHFGDKDVVKASEEKIVEWVKILDSLAGVASVLWFQGMENPIRRQFYGRAGEYRRPKHGLEYRTLGNAWLIHPAIFHLMYGFTRAAFMFARSGLGKHLDVVPENVRDVVDSYDINGEKEIVRKNKPVFKSLLNYSYANSSLSAVTSAMKAFQGGLGEFMHDPTDVEKNWQRRTEWWQAGTDISEGRKF